MDGVVASPLEVTRIRRQAGPGFVIVTPGIRLPTAAVDDQKRVLTPGEAMGAGADYLVVGRPIRDAADPLQVAREVLADMARGVLASRTRPGAR
jgi:orotidine-5'-phosphate decarboxylase